MDGIAIRVVTGRQSNRKRMPWDSMHQASIGERLR